MAVSGIVKNIANQSASQNTSNVSLGYLALAVPITKGWRSSVGFRPFSTVDYNTSSRSTIQNDPNNTPVLVGNSGEGNISEVFFSNGFKVYKGLTAGVGASYLFGVIDRNAYSIIDDGTNAGEYAVLNEKFNISGLTFNSGLAYRQALGKKVNMNIGGTYGFQSDLNYDSRTQLQRRALSDNSQIANTPIDSSRQQLTMPGFWQAGLSFDNNRTWVLAAELGTKKWTNYRGFNSQNLADNYRFGLGGEYTPDPTSMNSYFKRVTYRAGVKYAKAPVQINNQQINDVSLTAGLTLPLGTAPRPPEYNQSVLNLGVAIGQRGTTEGNLIRENYIRFMVGLSINNTWFIKPKLD